MLIVGSGAAGGMAAHVLTAHGLDVLMLEAGQQVDFDEEVRSMEWPYHHPRRGKLPPDTYVLDEADYKRLKPPYAQSFGRYTNVMNWQQLGEGPDYTKKFFVNEKDHPYTGTNFSWVRSRALGGKTNVWGRLALRLSDYDFKAASRDGYGDDWPIDYADVAPYYDRVDRYLGISGVTENLPWLPDSIYQRPIKFNPAETHMRGALAQKKGWVVTPFRLGVTTDGLSHNKYRSRCYGRGACFRRVGGCDIHAAFDSPTGLIYPAWDTGHLAVRTNATVHEVLMDPQTGKARGVAFIDTATRKSYEAKARVVVLAASTLESTRILLLSKSRQHPRGLANYSGHLGHNLCEHVLGPRVHGIYKDRIGKAPQQRRRTAGRLLHSALPQPRRQVEGQGLHPRLRPRRLERPGDVSRGCDEAHRLRQGLQEEGARSRRRIHLHVRPRRGAAALREPGRARSEHEGHPTASRCCASTTSTATTKRRCAPT